MGLTVDLNHLIAEKKRLDDALDSALEQFAVYEEGFNTRLKTTPEELRPMMFAERNQVEETLGIADLVVRLDELREQIAQAQKG